LCWIIFELIKRTVKMKNYCRVFMAPWRITKGSGLDDWIYYHLLLKSHLIKMNYSAVANPPTSLITRTRCLLSLH
jgi:hypothetical protein